MKRCVHQFVNTLMRRDAIGENALALRAAFRGLGYDSEIFCERAVGESATESFSFGEYSRLRSPETLLLIHFGTRLSDAESLLAVPDKKVVVYHNVTPGHFFRDFAPWMVGICDESRAEIAAMAGRVSAGIGVSRYNTEELKRMGFSNARAIPLMIDFSKYDVPSDPAILEKYSSNEEENWIFVGRICPNKKQEDLIRIFYYYQKYIRPNCRLFLVGRGEDMGPYVHYLHGLVEHLGVRNVHFTGSVTQEELAALYRSADLFLCMSEHEGFCAPILEAFHYEVPVIAFDGSAVGETLGDGGVLVKEKRHEAVAELARFVLGDAGLRATLLANQRRRLQEFHRDRVVRQWEVFLKEIFS